MQPQARREYCRRFIGHTCRVYVHPGRHMDMVRELYGTVKDVARPWAMTIVADLLIVNMPGRGTFAVSLAEVADIRVDHLDGHPRREAI